MREVILDTETTGINKGLKDPSTGHAIIEIACVEMIDKKPTGRKFHSYVNPFPIPIQEKAKEIHGIDQEFLDDKPKFSDVNKDLLSFIGNSQIVMHNAPFDICFLDREFRKLRETEKPQKTFVYVDTLALAREIFPYERNDLDTLAKKFNIRTEKRKKHNALTDSEILADVYTRLTSSY